VFTAMSTAIIALYWSLKTKRQIEVFRRNTQSIRSMLSRLIQTIESGRQLALISKKAKKKRKKRYIVFQVATGNFSEEDVGKEIIRQLRALYGEKGLAESRAKLIMYNKRLGRGILRVSYEYRYKAIIALGMIRSINGVKTLVIPLRVTGSLNRACKTLFTTKE